jgi:hypothetical protein
MKAPNPERKGTRTTDRPLIADDPFPLVNHVSAAHRKKKGAHEVLATRERVRLWDRRAHATHQPECGGVERGIAPRSASR